MTIEDAAAAFAARKGGHALGTFADIGIFSFERSKRVPAFRGAAIVINNEQLFDTAKLASHRLVARSQRRPTRELVFALLYNLATIPSLYGRFTLPRLLQRYSTMPAVDHEDTPEVASETAFYTRDFHPLQARVALRVLARLDKLREHVARLVSIYETSFRPTAIQTFITDDTDRGGMLRFPIAFTGKSRADVLRQALMHGVYLETNYERPLPDQSNWRHFPNALWAAENLMLLPLYARMSTDVAKRLAATLLSIDNDVPVMGSDSRSIQYA